MLGARHGLTPPTDADVAGKGQSTMRAEPRDPSDIDSDDVVVRIDAVEGTDLKHHTTVGAHWFAASSGEASGGRRRARSMPSCWP